MHSLLQHRSLQEDEVLSNADKLQYSFKVYGSIAAILFAIFLIVRPRFPAVYNVRNSVVAFNCDLARETYGYFGWILKVLRVSDDDLVSQCGLDSAGYIRFIALGMKMSLVGIFNAIYLIPIYKTAEEEEWNITDSWASLTLANVPLKSNRLYATLVAAYVFFTCAMIFIAREVKWFTKHRTSFLSAPEPQNYTIYIQDIPKEIRTNAKLADFFRDLLGEDQVVTATFPLDIPHLEGLVSKRDALQTKLNGATKVYEAVENGEDPPKDFCCLSLETVDQAKVEALTTELAELNAEIEESILKIEAMHHAESPDETKMEEGQASTLSTSKNGNEEQNTKNSEKEEQSSETDKKKDDSATEHGIMPDSLHVDEITSGVNHMIADNNPMDVAMDVLHISGEDGAMKDAAFVTFASLRACMITLQIKHNDSPWIMRPIAAPKVKDVIWNDVRGPKNKNRIALGKIASRFGTTFSLALYTVPVFFIGTFFEAGALTDTIPSFRDFLTSSGAEQFLSQIAPLLLIVLFYLCWGVMELLGRREGLVGDAMLRSSLCWKLLTFQAIQNFLVLLFATAVLSIYEVAKDTPDDYGKFLSSAIPAASSNFMQFFAAQVFLSIGFELLRLGPVLISLVERVALPYLESGQYNPWLGIFPLSNPPCPALSLRTSYVVLQIFTLSAFASVSPMVCIIQVFLFVFQNICFRHQFIYIYPEESERRTDTTGEYWVAGIKGTIICIILSEVLLSSILGLKEGSVAAGLLIPLTVFTIIFAFPMYMLIGLTNFVPADSLINDDSLANEVKIRSWGDQYKQPALKQHIVPEEKSELVLNVPTKSMNSTSSARVELSEKE